MGCVHVCVPVNHMLLNPTLLPCPPSLPCLFPSPPLPPPHLLRAGGLAVLVATDGGSATGGPNPVLGDALVLMVGGVEGGVGGGGGVCNYQPTLTSGGE